MGTVHPLWPPPKRKPAKVGTGAGFEDTTGTRAILPKRTAVSKTCHGCQVSFIPRAGHHRYCPQYFDGAMALRHLRSARRLLAGGTT
jgi:hypothetical protein